MCRSSYHMEVDRERDGTMNLIRRQFAILLVIALGILVTGCSGANDYINVETAKAVTKQLEATISITGALVPSEVADISAPFMGKVAEVTNKQGDSVSEGQVLLKLDDSQLRVQLQQAQSSYQSAQNAQKQAKINYETAKATLERTKNLYREGAVAKVQLDMDQKAYDLAKSQYESSQNGGLGAAAASVESIRLQMENAIVKSPLTGIVLTQNIVAGETATVGSPLLTVADLSVLKLKGTVSQNALPYLKKDAPVDLYIDIYPNETFQGRITEIGSMSVSTGTYFPVVVSMDNTKQFASGLSAHGEIKATSSNHLVLPLRAVVENNGESFVYVIEDDMAVKTSVVTGLRNDQEIEILSGLDGDEMVAVTNANHLFDSMPVKVVKE